MIRDQKPIIPIFCVLFAIFAFSQIVFSQIPMPGYKFLEVVDYKNEPVADASVRRLNLQNYYDEPDVEKGSLVAKTNQKGLLEKGVEVHYNDGEFRFSIDKIGYYPYIDYFGLFAYWNRNSNRESPIKIELLLIPKTSAERKAIGKEQQKREFFGAARLGNAEAVRKFIKAGLNPSLTTADLRGIPIGENAEPIILYAVKSGNGETVKEFLSAGVKVNKTDEPIKSILTRYLNVYPSRKNVPEEDDTPKISSYETGAISLIEAGANVNPTEKGSITPLMLAAQKFYLRTVKKLIEKGAFVDAQDSLGRTPLMYLIEYNKPPQRIEIANLLIKAGANVNLLTSETPYSKYRNDSCRTALAVAVEGYDVEMVKLLLKHGADVNLTCKDGGTPLNYAREISSYVADKQKKEIIEILEAAGAK